MHSSARLWQATWTNDITAEATFMVIWGGYKTNHGFFSKEYTDKNTVSTFNETFLKLYKQGIIQSILEKYQMEPAIIK